MRKIKKNIESIIFSKYSKNMDNLLEPNKNPVKDKQNSEFSERGMYVREDDQDWGSAGMNDVQQDSDIK